MIKSEAGRGSGGGGQTHLLDIRTRCRGYSDLKGNWQTSTASVFYVVDNGLIGVVEWFSSRLRLALEIVLRVALLNQTFFKT